MTTTKDTPAPKPEAKPRPRVTITTTVAQIDAMFDPFDRAEADKEGIALDAERQTGAVLLAAAQFALDEKAIRLAIDDARARGTAGEALARGADGEGR